MGLPRPADGIAHPSSNGGRNSCDALGEVAKLSYGRLGLGFTRQANGAASASLKWLSVGELPLWPNVELCPVNRGSW
jgi:hypothetical protein